MLLEHVGVTVARFAPASKPLTPGLAECLAGIQFPAAQAETPPHVINSGKLATPCRGLEDEIPDPLLRADIGPG